MDVNNTNSIKGIFVWLIIFCHKSGYGNHNNYLFKTIIGHLGQKVVSMFFFYSGFGILESFKRKGVNYAKHLRIKAFILFLKYQIIILIYLAANIFIFHYKITWRIYLLSVIFKNSLGNSNWFAFSIIIFYYYSCLSFRFVGGEIKFGIIIISFFCILHTIFVYTYFYPKKIYAVDTILCFVAGFYFSLFKKVFEKIVLKNDMCYFLITSIIILIYYKFFNLVNNLIYISIKNVLFALLIILITLKVKFHNEFLIFMNSHSFSIYLLQRLILWIIYRKMIFVNSDFIRISFEFTSIFFIASLFDNYTLFIDKFFAKKIKKIE
jgi:hypothetical protein